MTAITNRGILPLVFVLFSAPGMASAQNGVHASVITIEGSGSVSFEPDYAVVPARVEVFSASAADATSEMSRRVVSILDTLETMGFSRDDIPGNQFSLSTHHDRGREIRITGYTARVTLRIRTTDFERLADIISAVVEAGPVIIPEIEYRLSDPAEHRDEAVRRAVADAKHKAEVMADSFGARLGRLIEVTTASSARIVPSGLQVEYESPLITRDAITPERQSIRASLTATWSLAWP